MTPFVLIFLGFVGLVIIAYGVGFVRGLVAFKVLAQPEEWKGTEFDEPGTKAMMTATGPLILLFAAHDVGFKFAFVVFAVGLLASVVTVGGAWAGFWPLPFFGAA